jgi:hypothetical protein
MSTMRETVSPPSPGTSRFTGILISFITAIAVFAVGQGIVSRVRGSSTAGTDAIPAEPVPARPGLTLVPAPTTPAPAAAPPAVPAPQAAAPSPAEPKSIPAGTEAPSPHAASPTSSAPAGAAPTAEPAPTPAAASAKATAPTQAAAPVTAPAHAAATAKAAPTVVATAEPAAKSPAAPKAAATEIAAPAEGPPAAKEAVAPPDDKPHALTPTVGSDKPTDKDIAREAWRRNLPDISAEETRASVLIPIKGSIEGATYHLNTKPKSVIINLPKAESLITMRFYKIKREGFGNLWIKQEDGEGTTVKLMLGDATAPQVEIHDEYIRINVKKSLDPQPE